MKHLIGNKKLKRGITMTILLLGNGKTMQQSKRIIRNYLVASSNENIFIKHYNDFKSLESCSLSFDLLIVELSTFQQKDFSDKVDYLSKTIKSNNAVTVIISNNENCPVKYLRLHIIDRVLTNNLENMLPKFLDDYLEGYSAKTNLFYYNVYKSQRIINKKQILFFQSDGKRVIINTKTGQDTFYGKLSDCIKQPCMKNFVFIHQSYLVNMHYIDEIKNRRVYIGKWELPISRKYSHNVKFK